MRTVLQSFDTARFQNDDPADTKVDIDQARSEILSAVIFGHEIVIPAGVIADCPAAHQLLPEVLGPFRTLRTRIEQSAGSTTYHPFRLGLEERFVQDDSRGYDNFVSDYVAGQKIRLANYVKLSEVAGPSGTAAMIVRLAEAYLGRRWAEVRAINTGLASYFELVHESFGLPDSSSALPVTCKGQMFTAAPQALYSRNIAAFCRAAARRGRTDDALARIRGAARRASSDIAKAGAEAGQRGSWYAMSTLFEEDWRIVRCWIDHVLYDRMHRAYSVDIPSFFMQETNTGESDRELALAFLDDDSLSKFRTEFRDGKRPLPPAVAKVDWSAIWSFVAEPDIQERIGKLQLVLGNARTATQVARRSLRAAGSERAAQSRDIVDGYRRQVADEIDGYVTFLNAGQSGVRFKQKSNKLLIDVGRLHKKRAGTAADKNTGRGLSVAIGVAADAMTANPGFFTAGLYAVGETAAAEAVGHGINVVVDFVRRPSKASLKAADNFYNAVQDRVNYWLAPV
jgi:hypothetical protein